MTKGNPTIKKIVPVCFLSDGTARQVVLNSEQLKLVEIFVISLFDDRPVMLLTDQLPLEIHTNVENGK